jgi:hypothetical protein
LAAFFAFGFSTPINSPGVLLRLVRVLTPPSFVLIWVRFLTALFRALSPTGFFTAISPLPRDPRGNGAVACEFHLIGFTNRIMRRIRAPWSAEDDERLKRLVASGVVSPVVV